MNSFEKLSSSTGGEHLQLLECTATRPKFEPGLPLGLLEWIERKQHADGRRGGQRHANCIEVFFGVGRVATGGPFPTALTPHIIKALSPLHAPTLWLRPVRVVTTARSKTQQGTEGCAVN
jgi:hypothetical protein